MSHYVLITQEHLDALRMTVLYLHAKNQSGNMTYVDDNWIAAKLRMFDSAAFEADKTRLTKSFAGSFVVRKRRGGGLEVVTGDDPRDVCREVFEYWQEQLDHPKAKLDHKRRSKIKARLAEGYERERLMAAIDGAKLDKFLMGDNDRNQVYDDVLTILRDGPQVERLENLSKPKRKLSVKDRLRRFNR